jgi:hypothetical protein
MLHIYIYIYIYRRRLRVASGATAPGPALQAKGRPYEFVKHTNRDTDTLALRGHGRPYTPRTPNAASVYINI